MINLLVIGATIKKTIGGVFRALRLDDEGRVELAASQPSPDPIEVGTETDVASASNPHYLPAGGTTGQALHPQDHLGLELIADDIETITVEGWIGAETDVARAVDITKSLLDMETGAAISAGSLSTGAGAQDRWVLDLEGAPITHYRVKYTVYDNTNSLAAHAVHRKG